MLKVRSDYLWWLNSTLKLQQSTRHCNNSRTLENFLLPMLLPSLFFLFSFLPPPPLQRRRQTENADAHPTQTFHFDTDFCVCLEAEQLDGHIVSSTNRHWPASHSYGCLCYSLVLTNQLTTHSRFCGLYLSASRAIPRIFSFHFMWRIGKTSPCPFLG